MKTILLIIPDAYSLKSVIETACVDLGFRIVVINYRNIIKKSKYFSKVLTLLNYGKDTFKKTQNEVNSHYLSAFNSIKPDIVFIYNDELVLPETLNYFKKKSQVIYLLGDDILNLDPPNKYALTNLMAADCVVCADSTWKNQLERIGFNNVYYDCLAYHPTLFGESNGLNLNQRINDILFVGRCYRGSWGFKRCYFLDQFSELNIDVYGTGLHWSIWIDKFPKLQKRLIDRKQKLPFNELKSLMNSYKLFPVDINPGIISGLHLRVFECISAGILPLIEFTEDIQLVFKDIHLPVIKNYSDSKEIAIEYLNNNDLRIKTLKDAKAYLDENYSPATVMSRILKNIN